MLEVAMKPILSLLFVSVIATFCLAAGPLAVGTEAPDFSLSSHDGKVLKLSDYKEKNSVVLIFYPGDETPVCTKQLCEIRDDYTTFAKKGSVVFGINPASEKSHLKFAQKNELQFPLLIDPKGAVAKKYKTSGAMMNKRTVYVVGKDGKIIFAKRGKPPVSEILASIPDEAGTQAPQIELNINQ
jgi:peroxiredoxin Q/BCP